MYMVLAQHLAWGNLYPLVKISIILLYEIAAGVQAQYTHKSCFSLINLNTIKSYIYELLGFNSYFTLFHSNAFDSRTNHVYVYILSLSKMTKLIFYSHVNLGYIMISVF